MAIDDNRNQKRSVDIESGGKNVRQKRCLSNFLSVYNSPFIRAEG